MWDGAREWDTLVAKAEAARFLGWVLPAFLRPMLWSGLTSLGRLLMGDLAAPMVIAGESFRHELNVLDFNVLLVEDVVNARHQTGLSGAFEHRRGSCRIHPRSDPCRLAHRRRGRFDLLGVRGHPLCPTTHCSTDARLLSSVVPAQRWASRDCPGLADS
jgi:hypothetical protein